MTEKNRSDELNSDLVESEMYLCSLQVPWSDFDRGYMEGLTVALHIFRQGALPSDERREQIHGIIVDAELQQIINTNRD